MQFFCSSHYLKRKAKLVKRALEKCGRGISYAKSLDLTARLYGFQNYSSFAHSEDFAEWSPFDYAVDDSTLEARYCHQEEVMAAAGFADIAGELLDWVNPTGGFRSPIRLPLETEQSMISEDHFPNQSLGERSVPAATAANSKEHEI